MPEKIEITIEELNSLRRLLNEASETIQRLAAGGTIPKDVPNRTPRLTAEQKRTMKFERMLDERKFNKKQKP